MSVNASSKYLRISLANHTRKESLFVILSVFLMACSKGELPPVSDQAIRRVENCVCYRSAEGQQLAPSELSWNDPEKLRIQFSHCICQAYIDLKSVPDPRRYVIPGTEVR
jgi:hypothetical protein